MLPASLMNCSTPSLHTAINKTAQHKSLPPAGLGNKPFGRNFSCTSRRWATASNGGHNSWEARGENLLTLAGCAKGRYTLPWWDGGCRGPVVLGGFTGHADQPPGTAPPPLPHSPVSRAGPQNLPDVASPTALPCSPRDSTGLAQPGSASCPALPQAVPAPLRCPPAGQAPGAALAAHRSLPPVTRQWLPHRPEWGSPQSRVPPPPSPGGASCCTHGRRPGCFRVALSGAER